ncbi:fungal-specific transcription factor domain-containing protein [Setomelanomma holmii]|uniref:Fungal-specific transcription factor domain-containing protein n=1 Tax=Setomelanomma holmii TaxID=210430 RepID=A0A9P4H1X5_9PLEO|nr:fungal-specific transcription factor domain-containing protein [Setomelanomma holmii]
MEASHMTAANLSNSSQKRPAQENGEPHRTKRAKYTSAACNECKRCKVKCIRMEEDADCQRCATMKVACIVVPTAVQSAKEVNKDRRKSRSDESHYQQLSNDINGLREQVFALTTTVASLVGTQSRRSPVAQNSTPVPHSASPAYTSAASQRNGGPHQPQFVGPTRSAFSFRIAETSLSRMGLERNEIGPSSAVTSRAVTPEAVETDLVHPMPRANDGLMNYSNEEIERLLGVYQEEIACVHPIVDTEGMIRNAPQVLSLAKGMIQPSSESPSASHKDVLMMKVAIATALLHETHGKNEVSDKLIESVQQDVDFVSIVSDVELKDIQIYGMMSLYYCHTAEELVAWRAIGCAARQALEMGLHRKQSLVDNFKDCASRELAVQVFWVVYELDRRWSFGTSLSFALNDRDIDPQLPEPGPDHPYLKAMVAFARLCSRVWDALPPYGSSLQLIPQETEDYLDFITQNWLQSLPQGLQFRHPRLGLAPCRQPRQLHRLRTMLYLRGNYVRMLVRRHHVLTPDNIKADIQNARLVVDLAKDSIHVLVHLNETSDVYIREQSIYHYYLLSALAVVLLAVCHAPNTFAETCRDPFVSAVELVKGFSRHSTASRRLWKSIRGLLPLVKSLSARFGSAAQDSCNAGKSSNVLTESETTVEPQQILPTNTENTDTWANGTPNFNFELDGSMPDIFDMSNDLIDLYDVFGSATTYQAPQNDMPTDNFGEQGLSAWEMGEISRHFQGLI